MVIRKSGLRVFSVILMAGVWKAWPGILSVATMVRYEPNTRAAEADRSIVSRALLRWILIAWWKPSSRSWSSSKWSGVVVSDVGGRAHGLRRVAAGLGNLECSGWQTPDAQRLE